MSVEQSEALEMTNDRLEEALDKISDMEELIKLQDKQIKDFQATLSSIGDLCYPSQEQQTLEVHIKRVRKVIEEY